jgi:hypothetical protein
MTKPASRIPGCLHVTARFIVVLSLCWGTIATATPRERKMIYDGNKATVLLFVATGCPCIDAHRLMIKSLVEKTRDQGISYVCVFSNAGETRDRIRQFFRATEWDMDYVVDAKAQIADLYGATNTPQVFVVSPMKDILYQGPIDDAPKNQGRVDHAYLRDAVDDILSGRTIRTARIQPTGCWIVRARDLKLGYQP